SRMVSSPEGNATRLPSVVTSSTRVPACAGVVSAMEDPAVDRPGARSAASGPDLKGRLAMISGYPHPRVGLQWLLAAALLFMATLAQAQPAPDPATNGEPQRTLLVMGDSLSAGYGMAAEEGWVSLLADELSRSHPDWRVVNASISGETSAGGASRIIGEAWRHQPDVVVIALGANDGLRGLPLREMRRNLARMIGVARHVGAEVLLVGMRMPPNLGRDYTEGFEQVYRDLADL